MKSSEWTAAPAPRGSSGMIVTPKSGGDVQLKGYDARQRTIASPSGGTRTADILRRPGSHVPQEKDWKLTPVDYFEPCPEYDRPSKHPSK